MRCFSDDSQITFKRMRVPGVAQVSVGHYDACFVRLNGSAACAGYWPGLAAPPSESFVAMSTGLQYACGITARRDVVCFGLNDLGQASPPQSAFNVVQMCSGGHCAL
jgi:hypothetical protein